MIEKVKKDCFSFKKEHCTLLYFQDCLCCAFYKTKKQYADDISASKIILDKRLGFPASKMKYEDLLEYLKERKEVQE